MLIEFILCIQILLIISSMNKFMCLTVVPFNRKEPNYCTAWLCNLSRDDVAWLKAKFTGLALKSATCLLPA